MGLPQQINTQIYIGLGSNIEDREFHLTEAIRLLNKHPEINVSRHSNIYETDPVGYTEQAVFLNMVVQVTTQLTAEQLFAYMLEVEQQLGRIRDIRWGPRTIDLDLLLFGELNLDTANLIVPHPHIAERAFVLIPLMELLDEESIYGIGIAQSWQLLDGMGGIKRWKSTNLHVE